MKRFKTIQWTAILTVALLVVACSDFLDVEVNNQLAIENFYESDEDAEQALIAAYDILQWHENRFGWASPYLVKTLPSDESTAGGANAGDQPNYVAIDRFNFDATNAPVEATWTIAYWGVYRANLVINNVEPNTAVKRRVVAEAKVLRAYNYFELASMFGDVPLILQELSPSDYNQSRVDRATIYQQVEDDINSALDDLPLKSEYSAADRFRVSRGTALAILGKAHLYQEDWPAAVTAFNSIISSGEYDLEPDFAALFSEEGELGVESVFETVYITTAGYDWGANGYPWGSRAESNIHIQLMGAREGAFSGVDSLNNGWGFNYPSQALNDAFMNAGDTKRRENTLMSEAEFTAAGGTVDNSSPIFDYNGFLRRKYGSYSTESNDGVFQLNYGTNWRLIRYADILLMAAEAMYRAGNEAGARTELNKVRARAGLADVSATGTALFDAIVLERQLELALEGHRYLDLIRWGLAPSVLPNFVAGKHELYPIPANEILKAPNMAPNNPGW